MTAPPAPTLQINPQAEALEFYLEHSGLTAETLAQEVGGKSMAMSWLSNIQTLRSPTGSLFTKDGDHTPMAYLVAALLRMPVRALAPKVYHMTPEQLIRHWQVVLPAQKLRLDQEGFPSPSTAWGTALAAARKDALEKPAPKLRKPPKEKKKEKKKEGDKPEKPPNAPEPDDKNSFGHRLWRQCGGAQTDWEFSAQSFDVSVHLLRQLVYQPGPLKGEAALHVWRVVARKVFGEVRHYAEWYVRCDPDRETRPIDDDVEYYDKACWNIFGTRERENSPPIVYAEVGLIAKALCEKMLGKNPPPDHPYLGVYRDLRAVFPTFSHWPGLQPK